MTEPLRVAIKTFGCKLNQYESEQIREDFEAVGFEAVDFDQPADVYLINSCTVTHRTDRDTRRLARQARRREPRCMVIVTGCYAQLQPEAIEDLGVVDLVAPNEIKGELARTAADWIARRNGLPPPLPSAHSEQRFVSRFPDNTRAFVKVQDGCDASCAYCAITLARGASRSVEPATAVEQARVLAEAGHPEVVLVGINLGTYGRDLPEDINLARLAQRICAIDSVRRLRLSSIEPMEIGDDLLEMIYAGGSALDGRAEAVCAGKICRHLHIPLQSGCDRTLERMNRPYRAAEYRDLVERIHRREPLTGIGADVMVGFPGETHEEFATTYEFVEGLPVSYLHVFTYSARPGTAAAGMSDQVDPEQRKRRTKLLRGLSEKKLGRFAEQAVGETLEVVVETPHNDVGRLRGIADNYLSVVFEGPHALCGRLIGVQIEEARGGELFGKLLR